MIVECPIDLLTEHPIKPAKFKWLLNERADPVMRNFLESANELIRTDELED